MSDLNATPFFTKHCESDETLNVFAGSGTVDRVRCYNGNPAIIYLQFFDSLAEPQNGSTAPTYAPVAIPIGGYYESDTPLSFSTGCWAAISGTPFTFGEGASSDVWLDVGGGR